MRHLWKRFRPLLPVICIPFVATCGDGTTAIEQIIFSIAVSPTSPVLSSVGVTQQFSATAHGNEGQTLTGKQFRWTSSAPSIVMIDDATGLATSMANGTATITATSEGVSGSASVTIEQQVSSVAVTSGGASPTLPAIGATTQLTATGQDNEGNAVPGGTAAWSTSNASVVTVTQTGLATAVNNGTATITATVNGIAGTIDITVDQEGSSLAITQEPANVGSSGAPLSQQPIIQLKDVNGFDVAESGITVTASIASGGGTLGGTASVTTNANGSAIFTDLSITGTSGTRTLEFASGSLVGATSIPISIGSGNTDPDQSTAAVSVSTTAGTSAIVTVTSRDAVGQPVTSGGEIVSVTVSGANGATPPVTDNGNGTYTATYTPFVTGTDNIAVTINGIPVGNSPIFTIVVPAALNATTSTATVSGGPAGSATSITIQGKDQFGNAQDVGGGNVAVSVSGANSATPLVTDNGNGTYSANYTPTVAGTDNVAVTINGTPISGSPFLNVIVAGALNPSFSTATVPGGGLAGGTTPITVTGRDSYGNAVTSGGASIVVTVSGANSATPSVADNGNGTYFTSYSPANTGTDIITITMNGLSISGSPFTSLIGAGAADPTQTTANVPNGLAGAPTNISVQSRDASGNNLTTGGEAVTITVTGANTATPIVTDQGNGTYTASYTPTNAGTDNLVVSLNGIAISGSPYTSTISPAALDPAQSSATVPPGTAGALTSILITTRDAFGNPMTSGGATAVVTVAGANAVSPVVTDNNNGTYSTSYTPTIAGTDNVTITLNGVGINGSPFTSVVGAGPASASASTAVVPAAGSAGASTSITVTARDANGNVTSGGETVVVTVSGANTASPAVTDNGNGTHSTSYTPITTGTDNIAVTLNGSPIQGSPFTSTISAGALDPSQSTATVPAGTAGVATSIVVQARDGAGNAIATGGATVVINVSGANAATPAVTDNANGTYSASYTPTSTGTDNVAITINTVAIGGSPFTSPVSPGAADPTQSSATVPANGESGTPTNIAVTVRDANGNQLTSGGDAVVVTVTGANAATPGVADNGDGTYSTSYMPSATGVDNIAITLNGAAINGSPFASAIGAGGADPTQTTATVSANLAAGAVSNITVTARDGAGNPLTTGGANVGVTVTGANPGTPVVTDNADGTYTTSYTANGAGTDNVAITLNGNAIGGSPYSTVIAPGALDPAFSTITAPAQTEAGADSTITVTARDALGNQLTSGGATVVLFISGANPPSSPPVTDVGDGTYTATYSPSVIGVDEFDATINGVSIGGGPYTTTVIPGAVSAAQTTATVPAAGGVGLVTSITVTARDSEGNARTTGGDTVVVSVSGANTATPAVNDNGNGTYSASYTPTTAGADNIAITINGGAISGSPFNSTVGAGAADPAQSTATVPTTGTVGVATAITVQAVDGGGTPLTAGGEIVQVAVTGANTAAPVVTDVGDGTYTASYTPSLTGSDNIAITMNGVPISGSPFTSTVGLGGASAANSYAIVTNGTIGTPTSIFVQARDAGDNLIEAGGDTIVVTVTGANAGSPVVTDNGDGTYTATYTPTANGTDDVAITLNSSPIGGSSYTSVVSTVVALTGKISYESDSDGNYDVWIINENGSSPENLTNNLYSSDERPHISPDGTKIVFNSDRDGDHDIYVMNSNGSGVVQLTDNPGRDRLPVWSPDGSQIVFLSEEGGDSDIIIMNADGSAQTNITNNIVDDFQADWSPDGSQLVFYRGGDVWIMNANGSGETNLTNSPSSSDIETSWGVGGITFISDRDGAANGSSEVYTIQPDGTGLTRLTNDLVFDFIPSWSSDGRITWITERDGSSFRGEVWIMNANGTGGVRVTSDTGAEWAPKFQY